MDGYDDWHCDCSLTPFGGNDCTRGNLNSQIYKFMLADSEYGMFVPLNSSLEIPWQNPAHQSQCHRVAFRTHSSAVSLIRAKALFTTATFNLSISSLGKNSLFVGKITFNFRSLIA